MEEEILLSCKNCRRSFIDESDELMCSEHDLCVTDNTAACINYKPESEWW